ncbi:hypothetical protein CHS0354_018981 [Potamilus streckersoni]|uniref:Uncharacterized protein n=1 Tax=Potamilus streckersoni TaxID=2493646 RepID=A0AAE0SAL3_9BIVA|nr:hypothetical protein CHS0354_018981 [Potamilus streckersoni]
MATSDPIASADENPGCPICLGPFHIPRQLTCMHCFCENCLKSYIKSKTAKVNDIDKIECPVCQTVVRRPHRVTSVESWTSLLPINTVLLSISSESKVNAIRPCEACQSRNVMKSAESYCVVCKEAMCVECKVVHQHLKATKAHSIISIEELTNTPQNALKYATAFSCPDHEDENIKFYCTNHNLACCVVCCGTRHRNCDSVLDLKAEASTLLKKEDPEFIIESLKAFENHLNKFTEINNENINNLECQMNVVTAMIQDLRKKLNDVLDKFERKIKIDGNLIYKGDMIQKQEQNHACLSLMNAIRNSRTELEVVKQNGTDIQKFLVNGKTKSQLRSYNEQIHEKFEKIDKITLQLEIDPLLQSVMEGKIATLVTKSESQDFPMTSVKKPTKYCPLEVAGVFQVQSQDEKNPDYTDLVCLPEDQVMLIDARNNSCYLLDSLYRIISSYSLPGKPWSIRTFDGQEVVVSLPDKNQIQFLLVKDNTIRPTRMIKTILPCFGIAITGKGCIVVSGPNTARSKCYWSVITDRGEETSYHEYWDKAWNDSFLALNASKTRVYISTWGTNSLFCFDRAGKRLFVYSPDNLKGFRGITLDMDDNVYVVGCNSNNVHQLSPDGAVLKIITDGLPQYPAAITYNRITNQLLLTNFSRNEKIHVIKLD